MIIGINVLKTLTKHISCKCKCKFDEKKCNSNQWWNNDECWCECKTDMWKRLWILLHVIVKMDNV